MAPAPQQRGSERQRLIRRVVRAAGRQVLTQLCAATLGDGSAAGPARQALGD